VYWALGCFEALSLRLTMSSDWKQFFAAAGLQDFPSDVLEKMLKTLNDNSKAGEFVNLCSKAQTP
jgi:hypothetical protein